MIDQTISHYRIEKNSAKAESPKTAHDPDRVGRAATVLTP